MAFERESYIYSKSTNQWSCENNWPADNYFSSFTSPYHPVVPDKFWVCMEIRLGKKIFIRSRWDAEFLRQEWLVRRAQYNATSTNTVEHIPYFCVKRNCKKCEKRKELNNLQAHRHVQNSVFLRERN